ncbi:MAG TPA: alpha/beta fold hydrolase [Bryobacteraceae bacterium]|nr:alpha/beta fold hydrolase [Bryobacteraceae bacterium]
MHDDNSNGLTRRDLATLAAAAVAIAPRKIMGQIAPQANQGPPLDIADWSYHWIGVEHATLARGTMCNGMQMYVEHWIPREVRHPYPVILIHGGYGQGSDWISTPDGRRGWATLLLEQGYKVYVLDRPGQGRNPYHPWVHGYFDKEAPTFEGAAKTIRSDANDPAVAQIVAAMGQPMANNPVTQSVWRSRGAMLLDEIGPAILITHGDGLGFASVTAAERGKLVKAIVALDPGKIQLPQLANIPMSTFAAEKNDREALEPILRWMDASIGKDVPATNPDTNLNRDNTAIKLADQGCFWIGVQRKKMTYGTIAMGQQYVQYMIPAEKRYPYPVIMVHGGGGQGCHMMGIGGRPGWVHYFVQAGYSVYWLDRPSYGRSPYHPDALGPSHLPNVPPYEGLVQTPVVFNTAQWPGPGGMNDPLIDQFMANESGNVMDEAFHSDLSWHGGVELVDRIGPCILLTHAFGGFFAWGVADRRPNLVKGIFCMEINGNPFAAQLKWGLTASPMTYDPPVTDPSQFQLVDHPLPPDSPRPLIASYKLQAEPARKWKNLRGVPIGWLTSEFGGGGSPISNVEFLKQVGCSAEMVRLRDYGIVGNGNLMLLEKNNHEVFGVVRDWLDRKVSPPKGI